MPPDIEATAEQVFIALADPSRRAILAALASGGPATATDLAARLPITRQAVAKHLALLAEAGLVTAEPGVLAGPPQLHSTKLEDIMTDHAFTTTFAVDQTPTEAFDAITNVRGWWSEEIDGHTDKLGAEFTYRYEDVHRCRIRVTEAVPGRKVSWLVLDNHFNFTEDETEWTGTTISFDISEKDGQTEVRFTHQGLVPAYECFEVCSTAWGFYVNGSLQSLITTGEGQPNGRGPAVAPGAPLPPTPSR